MAWAAVAGAAVGVVGGGLLADDYGAEGANDAAAAASRLQAEIAKDQWDRYKQIYAPLEQSFVNESQNYDSPDNYRRAAGEAQATVASQFAKARDRLQRTPGLDPSTGAYQAGTLGLELGQAATDATQQNAARQMVRDKARAYKTDAISLGKNLPANAATSLSNVANNSLSQAQFGMEFAGQQARGIGNLVGYGFQAAQKNGWLGLGNSGTPIQEYAGKLTSTYDPASTYYPEGAI